MRSRWSTRRTIRRCCSLWGGNEQASLLDEICVELPARIYAHLSPGLVGHLLHRYASEPHGEYLKMALRDDAGWAEVDTADVVALGPDAREELVAFYALAYPGNWFDPRMLETRQYVAIRERGAIVAAGGVHVYSEREHVAALGNIAVAPAARGRGFARRVTAALCCSLREKVDHLGLNVRADNRAAI